jgi:hypothetical protein
VGGLLKGLKMTENTIVIVERNLMRLIDDMTNKLEKQQTRIERLERLLANREKKVSKLPGDREV